MAVFETTAFNESEEFENDDVLDQMLEACDCMLDAVEESTAAQRHYGVTSKDFAKADKMFGGDDPKLYSNKAYAKHYATKLGKEYGSGVPEKRTSKAIDIGTKIGRKMLKDDPDVMDNIEKEVRAKAMPQYKGTTGYAMSKLHQNSGVDVKKYYDKGHDKAQVKMAKKNAIKETCLHILSIIDEM